MPTLLYSDTQLLFWRAAHMENTSLWPRRLCANLCFSGALLPCLTAITKEDCYIFFLGFSKPLLNLTLSKMRFLCSVLAPSAGRPNIHHPPNADKNVSSSGLLWVSEFTWLTAQWGHWCLTLSYGMQCLLAPIKPICNIPRLCRCSEGLGMPRACSASKRAASDRQHLCRLTFFCSFSASK